jgi:flagellar hook-associated protein 3 FlgL
MPPSRTGSAFHQAIERLTELEHVCVAIAGHPADGICRDHGHPGAIGVNQQSLVNATTTIEAQNAVLTNDINGLEAVDPTKAASNLNEIMTQLETSYSLTSRLQTLSLLNYL